MYQLYSVKQLHTIKIVSVSQGQLSSELLPALYTCSRCLIAHYIHTIELTTLLCKCQKVTFIFIRPLPAGLQDDLLYVYQLSPTSYDSWSISSLCKQGNEYYNYEQYKWTRDRTVLNIINKQGSYLHLHFLKLMPHLMFVYHSKVTCCILFTI